MATPAPERPSVFDMNLTRCMPKEFHLSSPTRPGTFKQAFPAFAKQTRRTFPARNEHLAGVADTGARSARSANGGSPAGAAAFSR